MSRLSLPVTVSELACTLRVWDALQLAVERVLPGSEATKLLSRIAAIPVRPSHAVRRLGSYVSRGGQPVCIRLQFAQERQNLRDTFLHELAHLCDHLTHQSGLKYRNAHGDGWALWAREFGIEPNVRGESAALEQLYQTRLRTVAVCDRCGAELRRLQRLRRDRRYVHTRCGGSLIPVR